MNVSGLSLEPEARGWGQERGGLGEHRGFKTLHSRTEGCGLTETETLPGLQEDSKGMADSLLTLGGFPVGNSCGISSWISIRAFTRYFFSITLFAYNGAKLLLPI